MEALPICLTRSLRTQVCKAPAVHRIPLRRPLFTLLLRLLQRGGRQPLRVLRHLRLLLLLVL
jgi:hypothetical protein